MCHFKRAVGDHHSIQEETLLLNHLKDCVKNRDLIGGIKLHADIIKNGLLEQNISAGGILVGLYSKGGAPAKAKHVICEVPFQNVVSWNAFIGGYARNGHGEQAIECFEQMQLEGVSPDAVSFACALKACAGAQAIGQGTEIHAEIARKGFLMNDTVLGNALLDMYGKCGALTMAEQVFNEMPVRNVVSWTVVIKGCCQCENGQNALCNFERMQGESVAPDKVTLLCILQASGSVGAADKGRRVHAVISADQSMKNDSVLGDALVDMYVKCGVLYEAYDAFCKLPCRTIFSWTSLVTGYCQHGHSEEALKCYQQMKHEGFSPDAFTYACILKSCGDIGAAEEGEQIHQQIVSKRLLGKDSVLSSALVDMYSKCGELFKAQQVFDELSHKDEATWNVLIAGYCQHGHTEVGLEYFHRMNQQGLYPNAATFTCVLKACGRLRRMNTGLEIHSDIARKGLLGKEQILGSALLDMYASCGALGKAKEVFEGLSYQDTISWTALIAGYCQHGHVEEAFNLFDKMEEKGFSPDAVTFACILKACESIGAVTEGEFYFESMSNCYGIIPTLEDQTCMIDLFGHAGFFDKAMSVVNRMKSLDHLPAWSSLLSSCRKWGNAELGKTAFNHVVRLDREPVAAYLCLSSIYATAGMHEDADRAFVEAQQVFDKSFVQDVVSWNAFIAACCERGCYRKAILFYERMKEEGFVPTVVTFLCILKVCASEAACDLGKSVHHDLRKSGLLLEECTVLGTALVDMYAKCGEFTIAKEVFENLRYRDTAVWNALIVGYCQHGRCEEVMVCSEQMKYEGLSYDARTLSCMLKACGSMHNIEKGEALHADAFGRGLLKEDIVLGNALVDMYAKCGLLAKACHSFNELPFRNIVSWNTLITGYCKEEDEANTLKSYEQMKDDGISPDAVTLVCILKACGNVGAVDKGREVHVEIARGAVSGTVCILGSALVVMYSNCGALSTAQEVFNKLSHQDLASWTALIAGYCQHGYSVESLKHFESMICMGLAPDRVALTCVLKACSSLGEAEKAQMYMEKMAEGYGIVPVLEHHTCMVHLLSQIGNFDEALSIIGKLSCSHYLPAWYSILSSSFRSGNVRLGRLAFEHAVDLDKKSAVAYVCMSRLYAAAAIHQNTSAIKVSRLDTEEIGASESLVSAGSL